MRRRDYIPVNEIWIDMYKKYEKAYYTPILKFPIDKIKVDKSLFDFQNEIDPSTILSILTNFYHDAWEPIYLNEDYYLLDGQHRLAAARQLCLSYIDVIILGKDLLENDNQEMDVGTANRN